MGSSNLKGFGEFIAERYLNAIGDSELKDKYRDDVWKILQDSYKKIGGIKGSGFKNPKDMDNIPFWKLITKDGKLHGVVMYKDKGGRKSVAAGTDGSDYAKARIVDIMKQDIMLKRSYGEKSKAALGTVMKNVPWEVLEAFVFRPDQVRKIAKDDEIIAYTEFKGEMPKDAVETIAKYPQLKEYGYFRELGGAWAFKVMFGTPGMKIK